MGILYPVARQDSLNPIMKRWYLRRSRARLQLRTMRPPASQRFCRAGFDEEDATLDVAQLGLVDGIAVDSTIGATAGRLRARTSTGRAAQ